MQDARCDGEPCWTLSHSICSRDPFSFSFSFSFEFEFKFIAASHSEQAARALLDNLGPVLSIQDFKFIAVVSAFRSPPFSLRLLVLLDNLCPVLRGRGDNRLRAVWAYGGVVRHPDGVSLSSKSYESFSGLSTVGRVRTCLRGSDQFTLARNRVQESRPDPQTCTCAHMDASF